MKPEIEEFNPLRIAVPGRLESERLLLRCYHLSDAPTLSEALNANRERLKDDFPQRVKQICTSADAESFIWQKNNLWERRQGFHLSIWDKASKLYAGEICYKDIIWKIPKADIAYFVVEELEGQGIASEALRMILPFAFETLGMRKLQIRCAVSNAASRRAAEKCGFKFEGTLRNDFVKPDGRTLIDLIYLGMTPADYQALALKPPMTGDFS